MSVKNVLKPFNAWVQALSKPYTVPLDISERPGADRYRGWHINDTDQCIGCGTCADICQNAAIDMVEVEGQTENAKKGDSGLRPNIDYGRCCWCALCVDVCPSDSLGMSNDYVWIDTDADACRYTPGVDKKSFDGSEKGWRKEEGFNLLDNERVPMKLLDGGERTKTWAEVVIGYSEEEARKEAERCVDCGLCIEACPAHMHIPDYIGAIREGNYANAVQIIYDNNPMPEMCGKVCTRVCEDVCSIGVNGEPLAIRWLKGFATSQFKNYKDVVKSDLKQVGVGKKVAIIGGGPSGITVAYYLAIRGFECTIYDAMPKLGGATFFGIPRYRFPMPSLDKQVEMLTDAGVKIVYNHRVEGDEIKQFQKDYDAVFIGVGMMKPSRLGADGEELDGVMHALDMLTKHHVGETVKVGKKVIVVGGGNTAIDAARVSRRLGADVTIAYRRRLEDMPADNEEIEDAEAEFVEIIPQNIPLRVEKTDDGKLDFVWGPAEMVPGKPGRRPNPKLIEGIENHMIADSIIVAIGQAPEMSWLPQDITDQICDKKGWVETNKNGMSKIDGIFAGGDVVNWTADAISAIADGLTAVDGIQEFLGVLPEAKKDEDAKEGDDK